MTLWITNQLQGKNCKKKKKWKLNNILQSNQCITEEIKEETKKKPRDKWKPNDPKPMGCSKISSKREVYTNTILSQETRKISNKQPNLTPQATRERSTNKAQR